eukprot:SAG22_NODE_15671_length_343_cov_1.377049_1_plen_21_part_10
MTVRPVATRTPAGRKNGEPQN